LPGVAAHHQKVTRQDTCPPLEISNASDRHSAYHNSADFIVAVHGNLHGCIGSATSGDIDVLADGLHALNVKLDEEVQRRIVHVTKDEASLTEKVLADQAAKDNEVLNEGKRLLDEQEVLYREMLEKFILELKKEKSKNLEELHDRLSDERDLIRKHAQENIKKLTDQAREFKAKIVAEEQSHAANETKYILDKLKKISEDRTLHPLGSEDMTKIEANIYTKVGTKASGHDCPNMNPADVHLFSIAK
jgi:RNAse (barnase) inhibitor barstar